MVLALNQILNLFVLEEETTQVSVNLRVYFLIHFFLLVVLFLFLFLRTAVSVDVEEKLYRQAHAQNITSITISQRLALEEFHTQELKLGDANGAEGWALRQI